MQTHLSAPGFRLAVGVYLLLAATYFFIVPIFEGPDEWTHTGHVRHIAEGNGLPVMLPGQGIWGGQQPPLYFTGGALLVQPFDLSEFDEYEPGRQNPHAAIGYALDPGNKNNYLHYPAENFPYHGLSLAVHLLRAYSIGWGLISLCFIYLTACDLRTVIPSLNPTFVALIVATQPMFSFINAMVANEPANIACCAVVVWLAQRYVLFGPTPHLRRAIALGAILGLTSLAKMTGLAVGLVAVIAFLIAAIQHRRQSNRAIWLWRDGVLVGLGFGLVGGWWYIRNYLLYGDFFQTGLYEIYFNDTPDPLTLSHFWYILRSGEVSFWATFGWLNIVAPDWVYQVYWWFSRIGLIGMICGVAIKRYGDALIARSAYRHIALSLHVIFPIALAFSLTRLVAIEGGIQGRQLLPAFGSMAMVLGVGWAYIGQMMSAIGQHGSGKVPRLLPTMRGRLPLFVRHTVIAVLLIIAVYLPLGVVAPAYIPPPVLAETDFPKSLDRLDWVYRNDMKLLGVEIETHAVKPGEQMMVTAYWQALRPMETNYSVFVHLIGRDYGSNGQFNSYPALGLRPTRTLQPGQVIRDQYPVRVNGGSLAPARLWVNIGLFDFHEPGRPGITALNPAEEPVLPTVGQVKLIPHTWPMLDGQPEATLEDGIALHRAELSGCETQTATCTLDLTWHALAQPSADYTVFIQLWQNDQQVVGFDQPPLRGDYPTSLWASDEVVFDPHPITLDQLTVGEYKILIGLYHPLTDERLPLFVNGELAFAHAFELNARFAH